MEKITGTVRKIIYRKDDFTIAKFATVDTAEEPSRELTVIGVLLKEFDKSQIEIWGAFENNGQYGAQFRVEAALRKEPTTAPELVDYLVRSKNIPGIGVSRAEKLVKRFGLAGLIDVLDNCPGRLIEVKGISADKAKQIGDGWKKDGKHREITMFLSHLGILSPKLGNKIIKQFGEHVIEVIKQNPYRLIEVPGIGFKRADAASLDHLGGAKDSPERAKAILKYLLEQAADNGHSYLPRGELIEKAITECGGEIEVIEGRLESLLAGEGAPGQPMLVQDNITTANGKIPIIYLRQYFMAEKDLAKNLRRLLDSRPIRNIQTMHINFSIQKAESLLGVTLNEKQRDAVRMALTKGASILTGWPGTGKTTTLNVLVKVAQDLNFNFALAAPTGRAAKRMTEVTGERATTIHILLQWSTEARCFCKNSQDQLDQDLLIFDEWSMVDVELASEVVEAIQTGCSVLFVGDPNQLPSIGPGRVLHEMLQSEKIPRVELTEVFRQASQSLIVSNAHNILHGQNPRFFADPKGRDGPLSYDCYQIEPRTEGRGVDAEWLKSMVAKLALERVPKKLGLNPIRDIQVLVPQKKGACGVYEMNRYLQRALNPRSEAEIIDVGGREYRVGDRVMVTKNNYTLMTYNGDIGFITRFDDEEKRFLIDFGGKEMVYPFSEADELTLAYASTIHKSQGSEYPVVIAVILKEHWMMLKRNLLFTAATRAKKLLLMVAQADALETAVRQDEVDKRYSLLGLRLKVGMSKKSKQEAA